MTIPNLDILLYCHDGRGMGHASRTIAIGMALRRLFPELKVLFLSGFPHTKDFCGYAPLDWLKLVSYETKISNGVSKGVSGKSNYSDMVQGHIRAKTIEYYVKLLQPRIVLADHSPQGKHKELLPALASTTRKNTRWILGVRGVIGSVKQVTSASARETFDKFYSELLWYGDSQVLGDTHCKQLMTTYDQEPYETGYVSRMSELCNWNSIAADEKKLAGVVAIPWTSGSPEKILAIILEAIIQFDTRYGEWHIYTPPMNKKDISASYSELLKQNNTIRITDFGPSYHTSLNRARSALIFGGYNSLVDVLYAGINTVVIQREMADQEQKIHLARISDVTDKQLVSISEQDITPDRIYQLLARQLSRSANLPEKKINLQGAEIAARKLMSFL